MTQKRQNSQSEISRDNVTEATMCLMKAQRLIGVYLLVCPSGMLERFPVHIEGTRGKCRVWVVDALEVVGGSAVESIACAVLKLRMQQTLEYLFKEVILSKIYQNLKMYILKLYNLLLTTYLTNLPTKCEKSNWNCANLRVRQRFRMKKTLTYYDSTHASYVHT